VKSFDEIYKIDSEIHANLNWLVVKDNGLYIAIIPNLGITARGNNIHELESKLNIMLANFFTFYKGDKLEKELKRRNWEGFKAPVKIDLPEGITYSESRELHYSYK
jgi:hypothetical protein